MFHFKQFNIQQDQCAMKISTDAVLLGAWTPCFPPTLRILDIGTGSGCIALMLAQRTADTTLIDAIEIDPAAARQAQQNAEQSPWASRINISNQALQTYKPLNPDKLYDLIVCNPPYFENSLKSTRQRRNCARHTNDSLSFADLTHYAAALLHPQGLFCVILPTQSYPSFIYQAQKNKLYIQFKTIVYTRPDKPPKRVLIALSKDPTYQCPLPAAVAPTMSIHPPLPHDGYTDEYRRLTTDFYLAF